MIVISTVLMPSPPNKAEFLVVLVVAIPVPPDGIAVLVLMAVVKAADLRLGHVPLVSATEDESTSRERSSD
jgi:hypothetical protein